MRCRRRPRRLLQRSRSMWWWRSRSWSRAPVENVTPEKEAAEEEELIVPVGMSAGCGRGDVMIGVWVSLGLLYLPQPVL